MGEGRLSALAPLLLFMALMVAIGLFVRRRAAHGSFVAQYFIGGRDLGGFVLAMTTVATYSSVSSFVGGPGMAFSVGFGWVYMAVVQVTAIFLVLGVFGKRVALLARRFDAVTVVDLIRARYGSDMLAALSAFVIVLFFCGTMAAQFVGGANLFATVTGYSYGTGLVLFGLVVVLYTAIGGFRAVAFTDTCCALVMMAGIVLLLSYVLHAGGGFSAILAHIRAAHPAMLTPLADGNMPVGLYFTQWLLVGICTVALPQSVVRGISYKDTHSLHRAMLIGTFVIGFMNIGVNFTGILAHGVLTGTPADYGGVDFVIPQAIVHALPPALVGFAIVGPLAASISTISGLLIVAASALVKDVFLHHAKKSGREVKPRTLRRLSTLVTAGLGTLVFLIALTPPSLIWLINMFAFGGLETAFFWVLLFGLYWRRANRLGALFSMAGGTAVYCAAQYFGLKVAGLHPIVTGITASLFLFLLGTFLGKQEGEQNRFLFFPKKG